MLVLLMSNWIGRMLVCETTFKTILCWTDHSSFNTLKSLQETK